MDGAILYILFKIEELGINLYKGLLDSSKHINSQRKTLCMCLASVIRFLAVSQKPYFDQTGSNVGICYMCREFIDATSWCKPTILSPQIYFKGLNNTTSLHWHLCLRLWVNRLNTPSVYQRTSKCMKTLKKKKKKISFTMIVPISLSVNMDMVTMFQWIFPNSNKLFSFNPIIVL